MKYTDIKIGDRIRILYKPSGWASGCNETCPINENCVVFPFEGIVTKLKDMGMYTSAEVGNYGWDLSIIEFEIINQEVQYEIF